jgi:hypothetical protein
MKLFKQAVSTTDATFLRMIGLLEHDHEYLAGNDLQETCRGLIQGILLRYQIKLR